MEGKNVAHAIARSSYSRVEFDNITHMTQLLLGTICIFHRTMLADEAAVCLVILPVFNDMYALSFLEW